MDDLTSHSDFNLLVAVRAGDRQSFIILFERYWKALYIRACKSVDEDEAKDMVQEVMVSLWNRRDQIEINVDDDLGKYLFTALKYRVIRFYAYTETQIKKAALLEKLTEENPESLFEDKELETMLHAAIEALPERMRLIFRMSRDENFSLSEIAVKLGISEQTVKNQTTEALKRLRSALLDHSEG
ncbi:sigma-70 family RNA polymerase sigma factor [Dyadobacter arcticus]|uniref:RNA polymerase sigma-70 factor (ECF subfamily) n=1 Tax=Dyadobacter arcticus TaxID=1078754 RepID=A0ABX0UHB6_9BACT|nr:sigma-70 family RNA polymerase sigma factor [Dyadobacter arcticus]NIJ52361.1 RNA polymerase sigma-70 factor (ECF subfamily) [Dyadobacter arcticus]